ncbi:hypothetical protein [Streptomyces sp. 8L]|uniref:hypothetical protein n=1 Tax=Streptomyces sp. 8L TaxID=2877242 RepID=UPI001CD4BB32|nr:hypothetical protein [Streptomyces sp. 8L]MCA1220286.1 hypothetical protein [Streptomyces sp. 8L]
MASVRTRCGGDPRTWSIAVDPGSADDVRRELNFKRSDEQKKALFMKSQEATIAFLATV